MLAAAHLTIAVREAVTQRAGTAGRHRRANRGDAELAQRHSRPCAAVDRAARSVVAEAGRDRWTTSARGRARSRRRRETTIEFTRRWRQRAGGRHARSAAARSSARRRRWGSSAARLPSGAGHDAQNMALLGPMGMIFVPSVGGISHSPKELTHWDDCARGADVLLRDDSRDGSPVMGRPEGRPLQWTLVGVGL